MRPGHSFSSNKTRTAILLPFCATGGSEHATHYWKPGSGSKPSATMSHLKLKPLKNIDKVHSNALSCPWVPMHFLQRIFWQQPLTEKRFDISSIELRLFSGTFLECQDGIQLCLAFVLKAISTLRKCFNWNGSDLPHLLMFFKSLMFSFKNVLVDIQGPML
jgi:hypothetical protein